MEILASKFPIISAFGTILFFFAFVVWFWILITVFGDLFRRRDIGGGMRFCG